MAPSRHRHKGTIHRPGKASCQCFGPQPPGEHQVSFGSFDRDARIRRSARDSRDADSWKLVLFLYQLHATELRHREQLNPKTVEERQQENAEEEFSQVADQSGKSDHH